MSQTEARPEPTSVEFDPFAGPSLLLTAPSTESQREIWTACRMGDDASLAFNESNVLELEGELDVEALRTAVRDLVGRHEALHTTFSTDGLTLMVAEAHEVDVPLVDLSGRSEEEREVRMGELLARQVEQTFDLEQGPLVRFQLVKLGPVAHRLVFTAHHIVCDGWSTAILMRDLGALYTRARGGEVTLAEPEPFSAYSRAEVESAGTKELADAETYWLGQFREPATVLDLPTDRPRPALKTYAARREDYVLPAELVAGLKKAGARSGASFFTTLLAGFKALAYRLSGQHDIVVGIPAAGQSVGGHRELVGHCVNTLALRSQVDGNQPFPELLKSLRTTMLDAYDHQQFTYGTLLRKLPLARDPSRLPLVSVLFNLDQALSPDALPFEGLQARLWTNPRRFENFDMFVNAVEGDGRIVLEVQHNTDLFDVETIQRWMAAYEMLLRGVVDNPDTQIAALPLLTDAERSRIAAINDTEVEYPRISCIHELVAEQVARTPEAIALVFEGESVTFTELDVRANRLARALRERGVARGTLVGLCLERSPDMLVALLAVLKAGGAYVPLDPAYPADRIAFMIEDSGMPVLVSEKGLESALPPHDAQVLWLDEEREAIAGLDGAPLPQDERDAQPEDPAYVIYTSGSTGKPKGVCVPHRAVANFLWTMKDQPGLGPDDTLVAVTTLSFDIAVLELHLPLVVGARIVLARRETAGDGASLAELLTGSGATVMQATPSTWRMLLAAGWKGGDSFTAVCGGEAMPPDLAQQLVEAAGSVWNVYGPTETTVWSTREKLENPVGPLTIGRPIGNTQVHVLDERLQPVPLGVPGELHIGGDGVTLGYLNRPELTAERFVPDPFRPGALLYKTGDLARFLSDGRLDYLGRNDNQVKVRGFRIELGEIESILARHGAVGQAVVMARELRPGDVRLVAYLIPANGTTPPDEDLRAFLRESLPDYMVPQHFMSLSRFPLTPNGKIDRKALPQPVTERSDSDFVEPRTPQERLVAELWQDALGVPRLSVHDNFFHLGGHSLLASQVLARLRREHGVALAFRKLFEAPTVERFAALVAEEGTADSGTAPVTRRPEPGPAPLTLMQQRHLVLEEMDPRLRMVHRMGSAFRLRGRLDRDALRRSIETILERHDILRTVVEWRDGVPSQVVRPLEALDLPVVDWTGWPAEERESALVPYLRENAREPHDLNARPAFDARLIHLDEDDHVLFFRTHNAVWDGWSFDIFRRELDLLYAENTGGPKAAVPDLPVSYADFAVWHREWMSSPEIERQTTYWRERLSGEVPVLDLPTDRPRGDNETFAATTIDIRFTPEQAERLTALGREHEATLFMVLLAVFEALLHRYSGQRDILIGTPVQGRSQPEIENLIGLFVNQIVLRSTVDPEESFADLLGRTRDMTLDAFSHQDMPFELLGRQAPVLRAFFSLQDARERVLHLGDLSLEQIQAVSPGGAADMILWFMEQKGELLAALNFRTDLFDQETMTRFLEHYRNLVAAIVADPGQTVAGLSMVGAEESARVRGLGEPSETPETLSALDAFAAQVKKAPEAVAVESGETTRTYRELHREAEALAARLRALGVSSGAPVAVAVDRTERLPAAVLGVLRAGAACLPLDLGDPADSNAELLKTAEVGTIVTEACVRPELPDFHGTVVDLDEHTDSPGSDLTAVAVSAGDPAFVLPVPDADGRLKAVSVSHRALTPMLLAGRDALRLGPEDVLLGLSSPTRGNGIAEVLLSLSTGARLVVGDDELAGEADRLAETLASSGATTVIAPPAVWSALVAEKAEMGAVRAVCSPEPLARATATELRTRVAGLWNVWGPTATGMWSVVQAVETGEDASLGSRLPGVTARVLEETGAPAGLGVPGKLTLDSDGGSGVRARWRGDGRLEWLGRSDGQVLSGDRLVDPAIIEGILRGHPGVADVAVAGQEEQGQVRLVAYVVGDEGQEPGTADLRRHLRGRVNDALVPASFVVLPDLPRTADGAVNRKALPSLEQLRRAARGKTAPRTATEKALAEAWHDLLGTYPDVRDNFFDLGGHSLLATVLVHRVQEQHGRRLGLRELMFQTLEQIALTLDESAPAPDAGQAG
ncbi:MAG: amino acid adenylation domain-containing protein [Acidobacteria bacterium]|nr:amino acid adenylation domain-containing protein [Acidobacteriota bacterium]